MKVFISMEGLEVVCRVLGEMAVRHNDSAANAQEADIVVTGSLMTAGELLNTRQDLIVVLAPLRTDDTFYRRARTLQSEFPGRALIKPMVEKESEENIVLFLLRIRSREDLR